MKVTQIDGCERTIIEIGGLWKTDIIKHQGKRSHAPKMEGKIGTPAVVRIQAKFLQTLGLYDANENCDLEQVNAEPIKRAVCKVYGVQKFQVIGGIN